MTNGPLLPAFGLGTIDLMNTFDGIDHTLNSVTMRREAEVPDPWDRETAVDHSDEVTLALRAIAACGFTRDAAITAGHRALVRVVSTRYQPR